MYQNLNKTLIVCLDDRGQSIKLKCRRRKTHNQLIIFQRDIFSSETTRIRARLVTITYCVHLVLGALGFGDIMTSHLANGFLLLYRVRYGDARAGYELFIDGIFFAQ